MIELSERTVGMWIIYLGDSDFMMSLTNLGEDRFEVKSRLRVYDDVDPDPWSGKDRKRWMSEVFIDCSREVAIERCRGVMKTLEGLGKGKADEVIASGGFEEFIETLRTKKWFHMRVEKGEAV